MKVNVQYAETHLADLISAADNGEVVEIARPDKPALRLVISNEPGGRPSGNLPGLWGRGEGLITLPSDEEWAAMDKEIEDDMLNGPLFSPEKR